MVCTSKQSAQQVLFQMYNAVSIAELKGYAMMQFSWMILRTYGKGLFFYIFRISRRMLNGLIFFIIIWNLIRQFLKRISFDAYAI